MGADGAVYVSVGSTGNISAEDRDADPQRAMILRVPPGGGQGGGLRPRRPERHRSGHRPRRRGLDRGEQPRQHRVPVRPRLRRRRALRPGRGAARLRRRPPDGALREADAGPRPRLALLQPGPRRRPRRPGLGARLLRPPLRPRRGDERGRLQARLLDAGAGRAGDGRALRPPRPELHLGRRPARPVRRRRPGRRSTAPGTGPRRGRPRSPSSRTRTAASATSRPC